MHGHDRLRCPTDLGDYLTVVSDVGQAGWLESVTPTAVSAVGDGSEMALTA